MKCCGTEPVVTNGSDGFVRVVCQKCGRKSRQYFIGFLRDGKYAGMPRAVKRAKISFKCKLKEEA